MNRADRKLFNREMEAYMNMDKKWFERYKALEAELEAVKRERDAAVHDLNMSASCAVCIKRTAEDYISNDCMSCDGSIGFVWRGLCKENGGAEDA